VPLDASYKSERVFRFQQGTVKQAQQISGSMGLCGPSEIEPWMWIRRVDEATTRACADLREWLEPGELVASPRLVGGRLGARQPRLVHSPQHPIGREPCRPSLC
jgi:hypothetical protein